MRSGTKIRLVVAIALAGAIAGGVFIQSAFAQETTGATGGTGGDKEKVVFTWGSAGETSSLNPMAGYLGLDFYFWTPQYHLLLNWAQKDFSAEPSLATKVDVSSDSMTFTYTIRDDLTWSDGVPLTADDVAYTLNLYKDNNAYLPQNYLTLIDGDVVATDATHITFSTTQPTSLYSGKTTYLYDYILPKHVFEEVEKGNCPNGQDPCTPKGFSNVPSVGSGPFYIAEAKQGEFVRMVRNPYWEGPDPHIDEIVYRQFRNNDALAEALKAGEIDFAYDLTSPNIFNSLTNEPNIATVATQVPEFDYFNMNTGSAYGPETGDFKRHGDGHPALTDPVVRKAIRMAIDGQTLVDKVWLGYATPGTTIIPPVSAAGARWEPTGDAVIPFDPEGANKLLDDAGYLDTDGDGIREMPADSIDPGRPLDFRYFVRSNDQTTIDAAPFIQKYLKDIGIQTEVEAVTSTRLGDIENAGEFDLAHWSWLPDIDPDSALSWFTCDARPPDGQTYDNDDSYYCNPQYDELFNQQRTELDLNKRWDIVHQMQQILYQDSPYVILWYSPILDAYRTDTFTGYKQQPIESGDPLEGYSGIGDVWLSLRPVSAGSGAAAETRGIPAGVWIAIIVAVVAIVLIVVLRRRRLGEEDI
ncbi:MAG: ABC transporter substrate-binding protein [Actinomycetota bacterium]